MKDQLEQFDGENPTPNGALEQIMSLLRKLKGPFLKRNYKVYEDALQKLLSLTSGNPTPNHSKTVFREFLSFTVSHARNNIFQFMKASKNDHFLRLKLCENLFIKAVCNSLMKKPSIEQHLKNLSMSINLQDRIFALPIDRFLLVREEDVEAGAIRAEVYKDNEKLHLSRAGSYNYIVPLNKEKLKLFLRKVKKNKARIVFYTTDNSIDQKRIKDVINNSFLHEFYGFTLSKDQFKCDKAENEEEELKLLKEIMNDQKPDNKSQVTLVTSHLISQMLATLEGYTVIYVDNHYYDRTAEKRHIKKLYSLSSIRPKKEVEKKRSTVNNTQCDYAGKGKQVIDHTKQAKIIIPKKRDTKKEHFALELSESHILEREKDNPCIKCTLKKRKKVINRSIKKNLIAPKKRSTTKEHLEPQFSKNSQKISIASRSRTKKKNKKSQSHVLGKKKDALHAEFTLKMDVKDITISLYKDIEKIEKKIKKKYNTDLAFCKAVTTFFTWYKKELKPKVENICNSQKHNNVAKIVINLIGKIKTKEVAINQKIKKIFQKKQHKEKLEECFYKAGGFIKTLQLLEERTRDDISRQLLGKVMKTTNSRASKQKKIEKRPKTVRHVLKSASLKKNHEVSRTKPCNDLPKKTAKPVITLKKSSKEKTSSSVKRRKATTLAGDGTNSISRKEIPIKKPSKKLTKKSKKRYTNKDKCDYVIWILHSKVFKYLSKLKELSDEGNYIVGNYTSIQCNVVNAVEQQLLDEHELGFYLSKGVYFPNLICFIGDNFTSPDMAKDDLCYRPSFYRLFSNAIKKNKLSFDYLLKIKLPSVGQLAHFVIKYEEEFDNFFSAFIKDPILYSNKHIFQLLFLDKKFTVDELNKYIKEKSFPNAKTDVDMHLLQKGYIDHAMEKLQRDVLNHESYKKHITNSNLKKNRSLYEISYQININLNVIKRNISAFFKNYQLFPGDLLEFLYANDKKLKKLDVFFLLSYFYKSTFYVYKSRPYFFKPTVIKNENLNRYKILCDCLSMSISFSTLLPLLAKDKLLYFYSYIQKHYKKENSSDKINKKLKDLIIINQWLERIITNYKQKDSNEICFIEKYKHTILDKILKACDEGLLQSNDLLDLQCASQLPRYLVLCLTEKKGIYQNLKNELTNEGLTFSAIIKLNNDQLGYLLDLVEFKTDTKTKKCTLTIKEFIKSAELFSKKNRFNDKLFMILIQKRFLAFDEYRNHPEKNNVNAFIQQEPMRCFNNMKGKDEFTSGYAMWKKYSQNRRTYDWHDKTEESIRAIKLRVKALAKKEEAFENFRQEWFNISFNIKDAIRNHKINTNYFPVDLDLLTSEQLRIKLRNFSRANYNALDEIHKAHLSDPGFFQKILEEFDRINTDEQFVDLLMRIKSSDELTDIFFYHHYLSQLENPTQYTKSLLSNATKKITQMKDSAVIRLNKKSNYTKAETLSILMHAVNSPHSAWNHDKFELSRVDLDDDSDSDSDDEFEKMLLGIEKLLVKDELPENSNALKISTRPIIKPKELQKNKQKKQHNKTLIDASLCLSHEMKHKKKGPTTNKRNCAGVLNSFENRQHTDDEHDYPSELDIQGASSVKDGQLQLTKSKSRTSKVLLSKVKHTESFSPVINNNEKITKKVDKKGSSVIKYSKKNLKDELLEWNKDVLADFIAQINIRKELHIELSRYLSNKKSLLLKNKPLSPLPTEMTFQADQNEEINQRSALHPVGNIDESDRKKTRQLVYSQPKSVGDNVDVNTILPRPAKHSSATRVKHSQSKNTTEMLTNNDKETDCQNFSTHDPITLSTSDARCEHFYFTFLTSLLGVWLGFIIAPESYIAIISLMTIGSLVGLGVGKVISCRHDQPSIIAQSIKLT